MNIFILKAAKIIAAITSIHVGLAALGYDFCKPLHGLKFYWDVLSGLAGIIILAYFFMQ